MANTGIFHHIGTFLLLAATVLLLITTITAPVVNDMSMLEVKLANGSTVDFGTFGYCITGGDNKDFCTGKHIGYRPADVIAATDSTSFNTASKDTTKALTRVMVLHPVACGLSFIAFLLALGAGFCGAIFAAAVALLAWIVTVIVMATDFAMWGIIKNHVNGSDDNSGAHAKFGVGMWTELAAMVVLLFATLLVLLTCCSARMHKKRANNSKVMDAGYGAGTTTTTKRHFWQRKNKY